MAPPMSPTFFICVKAVQECVCVVVACINHAGEAKG